jgi:hypothetical protein
MTSPTKLSKQSKQIELEYPITLANPAKVRNIDKEIEWNMRKVWISTPRTKTYLSLKKNLITKVMKKAYSEVFIWTIIKNYH